ncbi:DUF1839 family protein [Saccharospirillum impatiens]|uniref:DUF1839 family protein n=1 Tax=Saccharospirillum impatiens TaxID=169438 RepID=UPI0005652293|nr:DUF1839 family protein [Saccharospirillum impatiens]
MKQILSLDPSTYQRHALHGEDRVWSETNCYVDVLIEQIHALGFDPVAGLAFTLAIDFEVDQWTFFKYPPADLWQLYGFEIQEMNPWHSLVEHVERHVADGRPVLVELDSCYLPDTQGTTYHAEHVKSTVSVNAISVAERTLGYFHGQSYYQVSGDDFDQIFQTGGQVHERMLPPYVEYIKRHHTPATLDATTLTQRSLASLRNQCDLIPTHNPFSLFIEAFSRELPALKAAGIGHFHLYSFATLRQFGACYALAETYLNWLNERTDLPFENAAAAFGRISQQAKTLQFQLARAIARDKPLDLTAMEQMAGDWQRAIDDVRTQIRA